MARINTYPENTSIEDNDSLLTYDGSASATKITPFSRIWTWVQSKLNALGKQNAIASADQLLMVKGGNTTGRIDYNVLAKAIIEQYNGSTIAGSAQTLQSALNALNSKTDYALISYDTAVDAYNVKPNNSFGFIRIKVGADDTPNSRNAYVGYQYKEGATRGFQLVLCSNDTNLYIRNMFDTWSEWHIIS